MTLSFLIHILEMMANRLKTLIFILVLSTSVFSGTPLQGGDMKTRENVCPMKCCKKKAKSHRPKKAKDAAYLCRVLVCSQNMPTNGASTVQTNFAPAIIASERVSLFEILFSTSPKESPDINDASGDPPPKFLPKYIQHQRILV